MAAKGDEKIEVLVKEFEKWQEETSSEAVFLLEPTANEDGSVSLSMLLGSEREFKLLCPAGYPVHEENFYVEADPVVKLWANALNEYLLDSPTRLTLNQVLNKAASLYTNDRKDSEDEDSEDDMSVEEEEDDGGGMILSDDDSAFTTEWELKVARKKKRWAQKEEQVREEMKKARLGPGTSDFGAIQASGQEKQQAKQIFTSSAASGILTNDLVKIMESEKNVGFTADPIEDNIYQWSVNLFNFNPNSEIAMDLKQIEENFGYNYIELQLDFAIDLYPFYPPLVKVIRPRLQASLMQRVTNMEMLKLSYWNPAKDMMKVLVDIKNFLEHWARLEVLSERNDKKRFPYGSYVDIEHHLLRLALVSEVNPRANIKYQINVEKPPENKPHKAVATPKEGETGKKHKEEYWAAGTGYGHSRRPEWDMKAYIAAQKEKDKQIEAVLLKILMELKLLYKKHAPQLKPRTVAPPTPPSAECIDPVEDMYNIIEGSALIPFLEQYLKADSFLEICRHTSVYKLIVDIIKEIAMQPQLLPLLGTLSDQNQSIYQYLQVLEAKANILLQHICKAGNGSIPKPPTKEHKSGKKGKKDKEKKEKDKDKDKDKEAANEPKVDLGAGGEPGPHGSDISDSSLSSGLLVAAKSAERTAEEKLARDFHVLFRDVSEAFNRLGLSPVKEESPSKNVTEAEVMDITVSTDEDVALETRYKKLLQDLLFTSHEMELEGLHVHRYYSEYKKSPNPSQSQVFRIAQELTSLSSSLPLELSSSIFVRCDDEKLVLMRALITGPEGTPYSGGCYQFDIFFPSTYPKTPPLVNLQTTGGGTVRFNPNLYNCGKVCLSLLGTWEGQQGERWNETTSTVLQVLVSIQSLILVPEPYYNEPGYEQEIGTEAGKKHSFEYNSDVRLNNIKYAMIGQLQNPSPGLEDVIRTHFYLKKDRLLEEVEGWLNQGPSNSKLERAVQNLRTELNKLQPPPNLANLTPAIPTPQQTPKL